MNKIVLAVLAVSGILFGTNVFADADMFRTIEETERQIGGPAPQRGGLMSPRYFIPDPRPVRTCRTPCQQAADFYQQPKFHGEPVVSEDNY